MPPRVHKLKERILGHTFGRHTQDEELTSASTRSPKKKALLVGIEDIDEMFTGRGSDIQPSRTLRGPHADIRDMRQFLIDCWNYDPDDIIVLINSDDPGQIQPTKENIERHCVETVAGARKGDCFFFYFAGHTTDDKEQENRKNKYIMTCDDHIIQDNNLRKMLVDPLPVGAKFVAILEASNLLALDHYRCNRVYLPWIGTGYRRTESRWNIAVRRFARESHGNNGLRPGPGPLSLPPTALPAEVVAGIFPIPSTRRRAASISASPDPDPRDLWYNGPDTPMIHCELPGAYLCTGYCKQHVPRPQFGVSDKADVICLSSAKNCQRGQDPQGSSLTQALITFLRHKPDATIEEVLTAVSHDLHAFYFDVQHNTRTYEHKMNDTDDRGWINGQWAFRQRTVEMDNFRDPQISSHRPLDMKRRWEM